MYYKKTDAQNFIIPGGTNGYLYPSSPKKDQTIAIIEMDGVYPESGMSINNYCTETLILVDGKIDVFVNNEKYTLEEKGDIIRILPKNKYSIIGKGSVVVAISPNWDSKQNHIIDSLRN